MPYFPARRPSASRLRCVFWRSTRAAAISAQPPDTRPSPRQPRCISSRKQCANLIPERLARPSTIAPSLLRAVYPIPLCWHLPFARIHHRSRRLRRHRVVIHYPRIPDRTRPGFDGRLAPPGLRPDRRVRASAPHYATQLRCAGTSHPVAPRPHRLDRGDRLAACLGGLPVLRSSYRVRHSSRPPQARRSPLEGAEHVEDGVTGLWLDLWNVDFASTSDLVARITEENLKPTLTRTVPNRKRSLLLLLL